MDTAAFHLSLSRMRARSSWSPCAAEASLTLEDGGQSNLLRTFGRCKSSATRCAQSSRAPDINTEAGYQGLLTTFLSTASCVAFTRIRQASGRLNSDLGQGARWQAIRSRMCYSDLRAMPPQAGALPSLLMAPQRRRTERRRKRPTPPSRVL